RVVRMRGEVTVLQRRSAPVGAWGSLVFFTSLGTVGVGLGWDRNPKPGMVYLAVVILGLMRMGWRGLGRARVELRVGEVRVVGLCTQWRVPAVAVRTVETEGGLHLVTVHGDRISVFAFSASLIDRDRTVRAAAAHIRRILPRRPAPRATAPPAIRRIDWRWADISLIPGILGAIAVMTGIL
uniref:hypothetical protein n=1 Tax=Streptomyces albus TaxID=1888 RepID=UPI000AD27F2F